MYCRDRVFVSALVSMGASLGVLKSRVSDDVLGGDFHEPPDASGWRARLEAAIAGNRRARLVYRDAGGSVSQRVVRPLGLIPRGGGWSLVAWCEARQDFRVFRLDRILDLTIRRDVFPEEPGRTFIDYLGWV